MALRPEMLDLGFVKPDQQVEASFELLNPGDDDLTVVLSVEGEAFAVVDDTLRLSPKGTARGRVLFVAPDPGNYDGQLVLQVKKLFGNPTQQMPLKARVRRAQLRLEPTLEEGLDAGMLAFGESVRRSVRLINEGVVPAVLDSVFIQKQPGAFRLVTGSGARVLQPDESLELTVEFSPLRGGAMANRLVLLSADLSPPRLTLGLRGQGLAPRLVTSPLPAVGFDFDTVELGQGARRRLTVLNEGTAALEVRRVEVEGAAFTADFSGPVAVPAGERLEVPVVFRPAFEGAVEGRLDVGSDDPDRPLVSLPLRGSGQIGPPRVEVLNGDRIDFGGVALGRSARESLLLLNRGGSPFTVELSLEDGDRGEFELKLTSLLLQPGESRAVPLAFAPKEEGNCQAALWVGTESGRRRLQLQGSGTFVKLDPTSVPLGRVPVGDTHNVLVEIANTGNADFTVNRALIDDEAFVIHNPVTPDKEFLLPAKGLRVLPLNIGFSPTKRGQFSAPLRLEGFWEEGIETLEILLTGTGVAAEIALHPPGAVDFGYVVLGQTETRTLVATNTGDTALRVEANALGPEARVEPELFSLAPGEATQLDVFFTPGALGDRFAQVLLVSNDVRDRAQTLRITGKGALESIDLAAIARVYASRKSRTDTLAVPWNNAPIVLKDDTKVDLGFTIPEALRQALVGRKFTLEWVQLDDKYDPKGGSKQTEVHIYEADEDAILAENFNLRLQESGHKRVRVKITTHSYPGAPPQSLSQIFEAGGWKWEFEAKPLVSFLTIRPGRDYIDGDGQPVKGRTERLIGLPGLAFAGLHDSESPFISGLHLTAIGNVLEALSTNNSLAVSLGVALSLYKDQFLLGFGRDIYDSRPKEKRKGTSDYIFTFKYSGLFKKGLFR